MAYGESKVYFDGSHYIAIPHTTRPSRKRPKAPEEIVTVIENEQEQESSPSNTEGEPFSGIGEQMQEVEITDGFDLEEVFEKSKKARQTTKKQLFEEAYREALDMRRSLRKKHVYKALRPYFKDDEKCTEYVDLNFDRKERNLISRRIRMCRKANLQEFNYFCTFTYDGKLHDESSFKKKLIQCISNFHKRKGWKYMGVWERSPEKKRLHFHGIFYIPEDTMPGKMIEVNDYSFHTHQRQTTNQSVYFLERFGRNDFEPIDDQTRMGEAKAYLMKYIEKSGEKIVYSKGLPQYFYSDILEDDVITMIGQEEKKLLLFDDFTCWDEGVYMGTVSKDVIAQMRKAN